MGRPISTEYTIGRKLLTGVSDPSGFGLVFELDGNRVFCHVDANDAFCGKARVVPAGRVEGRSARFGLPRTAKGREERQPFPVRRPNGGRSPSCAHAFQRLERALVKVTPPWSSLASPSTTSIKPLPTRARAKPPMKAAFGLNRSRPPPL